MQTAVIGNRQLACKAKGLSIRHSGHTLTNSSPKSRFQLPSLPGASTGYRVVFSHLCACPTARYSTDLPVRRAAESRIEFGSLANLRAMLLRNSKPSFRRIGSWPQDEFRTRVNVASTQSPVAKGTRTALGPEVATPLGSVSLIFIRGTASIVRCGHDCGQGDAFGLPDC